MKLQKFVQGKSTYIETPPNAYRTLAALREMGYKSIDALLDIVDNSLDAGATRVDMTIKDVSGGKGSDFVIDILDNGKGMDTDTLREALRLGSDREYQKDDLGRFGMGLVSAGLSVGRSIRVLSRKNATTAFDAVLDMDTVQQHQKFLIELHPARSQDIIKHGIDKHGTLVSLSKIDRINDRNLGRFAETLRQAVGRVYRNYIRKGIVFTVQRKVCKAVDPLMLDHELTTTKLEQDITFAPGKVAHLRVVELPDLGAGDLDAGITARNSGFYLVRNGREIAAAETFGIRGLDTRHHSYSHFRAELSFTRELDEFFHVNVKKNFIQLDNRMVEKLLQLTERFIAESGRKSRDSAIAPALPRSSHDRAVQLISGDKAPGFAEEDAGAAKPLFIKRDKTIVYNRNHPFMEFIAGEARQRPTLVLDILIHAISESGCDMVKLEAAVRQAMQK